jgi:ADP-ribose pyrophosphatase YjhB (NUDIX family)
MILWIPVRSSIFPPLGTILELTDNMKFCPNCGGSISRRIPENDNRERAICDDCDTVHYKNPIIVVGCVVESEGKILLCKRSIEPRYGYWTIPAGFMELGETLAGGAARETLEEACATVEIGHQFASVDVVDAGQVHVFFTGKLIGGYGVGEESLDTQLYSEDEIPWDELAFHSGRFALQQYFEDRGENNGVHFHELRHSSS